MAKKGARLREFEKNHRVLDISTAQEERKKKKEKRTVLPKEMAAETERFDESAAASGKKTGPKRTSLMRLIGVAVVAVFVLMVVMSIKNIFDLKEEERALLQRNEQLLQLKEELLMEMDNVNSKEYIEEQARKELKLVKGNELIFYFPDNWEETIEERNAEKNDE